MHNDSANCHDFSINTQLFLQNNGNEYLLLIRLLELSRRKSIVLNQPAVRVAVH